MAEALDRAARAAAGRVIAALAARFRDLDLAEDAFAEARATAARTWRNSDGPSDPAAWLYRVAIRRALDEVRRRAVRGRLAPDPPEPEPTAEERLASDAHLIPDDRLRLIFVCCYPALASEARAALTLRLVCGLSAQESPTPSCCLRLQSCSASPAPRARSPRPACVSRFRALKPARAA